MNNKTYHLALIFGTGKTKCWSNGHSKNTLVLQARNDRDYLSTDINEYIGERIVTKAHLKSNKAKLLQYFNEQLDKSFTHLVID